MKGSCHRPRWLFLIAWMATMGTGLMVEEAVTQEAVAPPETTATTVSERAPEAEVDEEAAGAHAIGRGIDFLLRTQRRNGSWGTGVTLRPVEILASVPGSHRAFRVGTTALCVMALSESPVRVDECREAAREGLEYLLEHFRVRRANGVELYNVWALGYSLEVFSELLGGDLVVEEALRDRLREAARSCIRGLERYQALDGGWGYYDFNAQTFPPSGSSASFTTATVLMALHAARRSGLEVSSSCIEKGLRAIKRLRKEDGSYAYGTRSLYRPAILYNRIEGSLGRTPTCDLALWLHGENVTRKELLRGIERLFRRHHFIDIGRKRPWPHEAWYYTSGYYFYYGHYYAARVIELLPAAAAGPLRRELTRILVERQEKDGSWWDFPFYGYHKAYGTSLAVLALTRG